MTIEITKEKAVKMFGSQAALARALKISRASVCVWPTGKPIPELQAMKIRFILKPECFEGNKVKAAPKARRQGRRV